MIKGDSKTISNAVKQGSGASAADLSIADQVTQKLTTGGGSTFVSTLTKAIAADPTNTNLLVAVQTVTFQGAQAVDATPTFQPTVAPKLTSDKNEINILVIVLPVVLGVAFLVAVGVLIFYCGKQSGASSVNPQKVSPQYDIVPANTHQATF